MMIVYLLFRTGKACTTIFCAASFYRYIRYNNNHYPCSLKHNHSIFRAILVDKSQLQCTSNVNIITLEFQTIHLPIYGYTLVVLIAVQIAKLSVYFFSSTGRTFLAVDTQATHCFITTCFVC